MSKNVFFKQKGPFFPHELFESINLKKKLRFII